MSYNFTEKEQAILRIAQENLPDSATPYADIAKSVGASEEEVLTLLQKLKDDGAIRRFGASIKHQKTGWSFNAMVAWAVSEENADAFGDIAAKFENISHCYFRPSSAEDWPYTLYTMVHGHSEEECEQTINKLKAATGVEVCAALESIEEFKKTSMTYF